MTTPQPPTCLTCHYALTGVLTARCPECGRDFNPADPTTFGPRPLAGVDLLASKCAAMWFLYPFTWLGLLVLGVMVIIATPPNPQYGYRWAFFTRVLIGGLMLGYAALMLLTAAANAYLHLRSLPKSPLSRTWFVLPVAVMLYCVAHHFIGLPGLEWLGL